MSVPPSLPGPDPRNASPTAARDLAAMLAPVSPQTTGTAASLYVAPSEPFLLRHAAACWRISQHLETPTLLPDVVKHPLAPGVCGVRTLGRNEDPVRAYEASVWAGQKNGFVYLNPDEPVPADCLPAGVPAGSYIRGISCRHPVTNTPGTHYVEAWQVPLPTPTNEKQEWEFDRASYERWLLYLVKSGQIAPPTDRVVAKLVERIGGHVVYARTAATTDPEMKKARIESRLKRLEHAQAAAANLPTPETADRDVELAQLRRQLAELEAQSPAPARKRRTKAAKPSGEAA